MNQNYIEKVVSNHPSFKNMKLIIDYRKNYRKWLYNNQVFSEYNDYNKFNINDFKLSFSLATLINTRDLIYNKDDIECHKNEECRTNFMIKRLYKIIYSFLASPLPKNVNLLLKENNKYYKMNNKPIKVYKEVFDIIGSKDNLINFIEKIPGYPQNKKLNIEFINNNIIYYYS